jgi:outer membrane protease
MKRVISVIFLLLFSISLLQALESLDGAYLEKGDSVGFSIEPSFGYLLGQAREIVYDTGNESTEGMSSSNGYYLSELIWDLKNIFYIGTAASLNIKNKFFINAGVWTAVNDGNGFMNDYDWIYWDSIDGVPYILHDRDGKIDLSHWSESTVSLEESLIFDINGSYDFVANRKANLSALVGYKYIYWDWSDSVIDSMYDGVEDVIEEGVNGIDYNLGLHIPYLGIGYGLDSEIGFKWRGRVIYSPLVIAMDHDHHILRSLHFYDNAYFGQFLSGSLEFGYHFSSLFSLSGRVSGDYLFEVKGSTYVYNESEVLLGIISDGAGMQYQALSISINAAFSF